MRRLFPSLFAAMFAASAFAADPVPPVSPPKPAPIPGVRFPVVTDPTPVNPPSPSKPVAVPSLAKDVFYFIDSDLELIVLSSPVGVVKVTPETGPLRVMGKFIDSNGEVVTKTFAGKYLYRIQPLLTSRCEIIAVPVGVKAVGDILRRTIDSNTGPIPPPVVPPAPVDPTPVPVLTPFQVKVQAAFAKDTATKAQVAKYAALYRVAATTTVMDTGITTNAAFAAEMALASKNLGLPPGCLANTARAVADELNLTDAKFGTLDAAARAVIQASFLKAADALDLVSK